VVVLVEAAVVPVVLEAQQELVSLLQLQDGPVAVVAELVDILALVVQEEHQLEAMVLPVLAAVAVVEEEMMLQTGHHLLHIVMHQVLVEALCSMAAVAMVQAVQEILQMVIIIQVAAPVVQVVIVVVTEALHMDIQVQFLQHQQQDIMVVAAQLVHMVVQASMVLYVLYGLELLVNSHQQL
jgi:hypothetical protein